MQFIQKDNPKTIKAWTFYDWANSVFPLVITSAIFPNFYDYVTTHDEAKNMIGKTVMFFGREFENQNIYTFIYAFALTIVVIITPLLSGIADYLGNKKRFLQFFCYLGSLSCMCLYFFDRNHLELSFIPFVMVFKYQENMVDGNVFTTGFFKVKYSFLLTGIWWMGFAQYTFKNLPDKSHTIQGKNTKGLLLKGFKELITVSKQIIKIVELKRFLGSYFFYNMGVQTVMVVAVLFARNEIDWGIGEAAEKDKTTSLIISILIIQFIGVLGAFVFSRMSSRIGNIKSIMVAIAIWIFICFYTYLIVRLPIHFYVVAVLVGFVMGGIQSLSRSTYSKLLPVTEDNTSYFSFYDVMEKLGMIIGTVSFGLISEMTGGMRPAVLSLILFFVIGFIGLLFVPKKLKTH